MEPLAFYFYFNPNFISDQCVVGVFLKIALKIKLLINV